VISSEPDELLPVPLRDARPPDPPPGRGQHEREHRIPGVCKGEGDEGDERDADDEEVEHEHPRVVEEDVWREAGEEFDHRGLPGAVRAEEAEERPLLDREGDGVHGRRSQSRGPGRGGYRIKQRLRRHYPVWLEVISTDAHGQPCAKMY